MTANPITFNCKCKYHWLLLIRPGTRSHRSMLGCRPVVAPPPPTAHSDVFCSVPVQELVDRFDSQIELLLAAFLPFVLHFGYIFNLSCKLHIIDSWATVLRLAFLYSINSTAVHLHSFFGFLNLHLENSNCQFFVFCIFKRHAISAVLDLLGKYKSLFQFFHNFEGNLSFGYILQIRLSPSFVPISSGRTVDDGIEFEFVSHLQRVALFFSSIHRLFT